MRQPVQSKGAASPTGQPADQPTDTNRRTDRHDTSTKVWDVAAQAPVLELHQKSVTKESWPVVQWAGDDSGAWHGVTNTVHFYGRADGFKGEGAIGGCKQGL
jgi:hypothetical protein